MFYEAKRGYVIFPHNRKMFNSSNKNLLLNLYISLRKNK